MPLPACAYDAIRRKFRDEQEFMGYEDDEWMKTLLCSVERQTFNSTKITFDF